MAEITLLCMIGELRAAVSARSYDHSWNCCKAGFITCRISPVFLSCVLFASETWSLDFHTLLPTPTLIAKYRSPPPGLSLSLIIGAVLHDPHFLTNDSAWVKIKQCKSYRAISFPLTPAHGDWTRTMLTLSGSRNKTVSFGGSGSSSRPDGHDLRYARSTYDLRKLALVIEREETSNRSDHQCDMRSKRRESHTYFQKQRRHVK